MTRESDLGLCLEADGLLRRTAESLFNIMKAAAVDTKPYDEAYSLINSVSAPDSRVLRQLEGDYEESNSETHCQI